MKQLIINTYDAKKKEEGRNFTDGELDELCEYLLGTCESLEWGMEKILDADFESFSTEDLHYIDDRISTCQVCGWVYNTYDVNEDYVCADCEAIGDA